MIRLGQLNQPGGFIIRVGVVAVAGTDGSAGHADAWACRLARSRPTCPTCYCPTYTRVLGLESTMTDMKGAG